MAFTPPFFSGSSAARKYVASSNLVVGSQQVPGSLLERASVQAVTTPGGTERLWVYVHSQVVYRSHLQRGFHFRVQIRGTQPFCRLSLVSDGEAPAKGDSTQAWAEMPQRGVPLLFEA